MAKRPQRRDRMRRIVAKRQLIRMERAYAVALLRYFRRVAQAMRTHGVSNPATVDQVIDFHHHELVTLIRTWVKRIAFMFGRQTIDHVTARVAQVTGKDAFDDFSASVLEWVDAYALDQSTKVNGTLKKRAKTVLEQAFNDGLGEEEAAKLLVDAIGGSLIEAESIARTELHTAANQASHEGALATGLDMVKEWAATDDDRTRPTHADADGQRQEMDEPFEVGEALLQYPGDQKGPANEVINCRCIALYHPRIDGEVFD